MTRGPSSSDCAACGYYITHYDDEPPVPVPTCSYQCALHMIGWGVLELRREESGWRHYLHNEAVRCGSGLQLKAAPVEVPRRADFSSDYSHRNALRDAEAEAVRRGELVAGRYESPLACGPDREPPALLYVAVAGYDAVITLYGDARLRWPVKHRGY